MGEEVSHYSVGDKVTILEEFSEDLVQVVIKEGVSKGELVTVEKSYLDY